MNVTFVHSGNLKKPYLETLATHELIQLADTFGIDIPPELDRPFIIEELLEAAEDEEDNPGEDMLVLPRKLVEKRISEPVPIPKQYNITFIEVLRRDPLWAFTFWEVKNADKELYERDMAFDGYELNVIPDTKGDPFVIPVGVHDDAWYIGFPPEEGPPAGRPPAGRPTAGKPTAGRRFTVELCAVLRDEEKITLAVSQPFSMPRLFNPVADAALYENPLTRLSGLADFTILRNIDRESRIKRV
jgi:hypothetical protein